MGSAELIGTGKLAVLDSLRIEATARLKVQDCTGWSD